MPAKYESLCNQKDIKKKRGRIRKEFEKRDKNHIYIFYIIVFSNTQLIYSSKDSRKLSSRANVHNRLNL